MADLVRTRSVTLTTRDQRFESIPVTLDPLAAELVVKLRKPTTANPLNWPATSRILVTIQCDIDGVVFSAQADFYGGIEVDREGQELPDVVLRYELPVGVGPKTEEWLKTAPRDEHGHWHDVPLQRIGELGTTRLGRVRIDRLDGDADLDILVGESKDAPAPRLPTYHRSIAHVSSSGANASGTGTTLSHSHSAGSGSDRLLMVSAGFQENSSVDVSSVTYNSVSMTVTGNVRTYNRMSFWRLVAPATGSNTVLVTYSATVPQRAVSASDYTGVDQTTPVGTPATDSGDSTSTSLTPGSAVNDVVVSAFTCWASVITNGTDQTERFTQENSGAHRVTEKAGASPTTTMSYSWSGSNPFAHVAVALKEAAGGGGRTTKNTRAFPLGSELGMNWRN